MITYCGLERNNRGWNNLIPSDIRISKLDDDLLNIRRNAEIVNWNIRFRWIAAVGEGLLHTESRHLGNLIYVIEPTK